MASHHADAGVSIWSGEVHDCPDRGVLISRRFNRLHSAVNNAKSVIAKSVGANKAVMLSNLTVFDPAHVVVLPAERIKFGLTLGLNLGFMSWLQKQPLLSTEEGETDAEEASSSPENSQARAATWPASDEW